MKPDSCYDCVHFIVCKYTLVGQDRCHVPVKSDADIRPLLTALAQTCATHCSLYKFKEDT